MPQRQAIQGIDEIIRHIRLIAFDFDGVFTDNMVFVFQDVFQNIKLFFFTGNRTIDNKMYTNK